MWRRGLDKGRKSGKQNRQGVSPGILPALAVYSADIRKAAQAENAKAESDIQKQGVGIAPACFIVGKYPQSAGAHTVPVNGGFMESQ